MGALKQGLTEPELKPLVDAWRSANPAIVRFWKALESAAITAVESGTRQTVKPGIHFFCKHSVLFIELPSGRRLSYMRPKLREGQYGPSLTYEGMNQTTKTWLRKNTYGGKLCENVTQAIARDCLMHSLLKVDKAGYRTIMHVHDELVIEMPDDTGSLKEVESIMSEAFSWSTGLPLGADGFEGKYYKK